MRKHAPVLACSDLLECITGAGEDTPVLQDLLRHYCGEDAAPAELRGAHPFLKLHCCESLVRACGAEGLNDRVTIMDRDKINKNHNVYTLLGKMADLNTSSSGDTLFDKVTKMLKSVLALKVEDSDALFDNEHVLRCASSESPTATPHSTP